MKKIFLACSLAIALGSITSCSTQTNTAQTQTETSFYKLKGQWQITSINYNSKKFKVKPFDEGANAECFEGSTWTLIPNNNSGSYTLSGGADCPNVTQAIKFEVTKNKEFKFKKLVQNVKAKNVIEGYVLDLQNHQENSFTLVQSVPFEGEIVKVYYNFEKISTSTR